MRPELQRFLHHLRNDPQFAAYARSGVDPEWQKITSCATDHLIGETKNIPIEDAAAGIVAYASGEALYFFGDISRTPPSVFLMTAPDYTDGTPGFNPREVRNGLGGVSIWHGASASQDGNPRNCYSTSLRNSGSSRIRVYKFGVFPRGLLGIVKEPKTAYYSPRQFQEWFRVPDPEGWISPGETVCDPDNYGGGRGIWAFFCETWDGEKFIGTVPLERRDGIRATLEG